MGAKNDTKNRVATLLVAPDRKSFLIGHAPNRKFEDNQWDIAGKGHVAEGDNFLETCMREVWEETGIRIPDETDLTFLGSVRYQTGTMAVYMYVLDELPEQIECNSFFEWYGKKLPEFSEYKWISFEEAGKYLYKGLFKALSELEILKN